MLRKAIRTKGRQRQVSTVQSVPAPIGGWNTRDPLAQMPVEDAVELTNWFPTPSDVVIRGGTSAYSTGITGTVETLAIHTAEDGTEQLFAITDTDAYDCSSSGAASAESWSFQSDGKYQWINMGDGTTNWLLMFNGVDRPKYYDGSSWIEVTGATVPSIGGATSTSLINPCQYHGRLFVIQKDTLSFWYGAAGVVGGTFTEFKLDSFANRGGYLMWAATWTFDAGDGMDDYIVFMTSEGEAIVYTGTDPSTSTQWARLGTYFLGKPLGRRSFVQFGGDLLAITQEGVFNMSEGLKYARINERVAITDKIKDSFNIAARDVGTAFGWEATLYPLKNAILFNIPLSLGTEQYVVNTITGAWSRFSGWDGDVFVIYNDELYFGGSTIVTKAWTGVSDLGNNIVAEFKTAYNNFGEVSQSKQVKMFRPMLQTNGNLSYLTDVDIDFNETDITGIATYVATTSGVWDTAKWDDGTWQGGLSTVRQWSSPDATVGYYIAGKVKIETKITEVHCISLDYVLEQGGILS